MLLRVLTFCLVLLLGACANSDSPQAVCRRQASNDPEVRALTVQALIQPMMAPNYYPEIEFHRRQAELRCLQNKGLATPGGVEPVMPSPFR